MSLWDIIRDWFVMYIWGGITSDGTMYFFSMGRITNPSFDYSDAFTGDFFINIGNMTNGGDDTIYNQISFGDWLSTTSTIVVLVILCIIFGLMVRWLFRLTSGLLQGR